MTEPRKSPEELRAVYRLPAEDDDLLSECDVSYFKSSGPGGQQNRTMSAVRLYHRPSGFVTIGKRDRSQRRNLEAALERLRKKLAQALEKPKPRKRTAPTRASREKRLEEKKASKSDQESTRRKGLGVTAGELRRRVRHTSRKPKGPIMERLLRKPDTTPTPDPRGYAYGLPPALLRRTAFRLGMAALVYAATYTLAYGSNRLLGQTHQAVSWGPVPLDDLLSLSFILLSLGVFFFCRKKDLNPSRLLDLGLVYEVVGALGIEIGIILHPEGPTGDFSGISWTCVWIVIFPVIVPATPGKTLLAALTAASAGPFLYLVSLAMGGDPVGVNILVNYLLSPYICVGIAYVTFRVVYRLRSDAHRAEQMGSYRLVEKLGVGGMGEVWRAEHQMLARPAAVKLIRPETLGARDERGKQELLTRFNREAQATAGLTSQNTVQLYDFGVTDQGVFYYVMELLHGMDLTSMMDRFGPQPPERNAYFFHQICESLAEAHHHGLIHRDIKPANVFVCRLGLKVDVAKVLDFGLVKSSGGVDETQVTMPQVTAGTPAFMAPEQVTGEGHVDHRADIYALGCLMYWLLTGRLVFEELNPMQVAFAHVHTKPEPPSRKTELEIPPGMEDLVMACLEKEPGKRPQSAQAIADRVKRDSPADLWNQERALAWWRTYLPELTGSLPGGPD